MLHSFGLLVLKMQRFGLLGRIVNISLLGEKTVLRRNVFTMEGRWKGNEIACSSVDDKDQVEVTILKDLMWKVEPNISNKQTGPSEKGR
jgi:hypothetical protein